MKQQILHHVWIEILDRLEAITAEIDDLSKIDFIIKSKGKTRLQGLRIERMAFEVKSLKLVHDLYVQNLLQKSNKNRSGIIVLTFTSKYV